MSQTDSISDMLTRIRNANMTKADMVEMPYSNMKNAIARTLKREGFIIDYTSEGRGVEKILRLYLKFVSGKEREPVIRGLRRISKPGLRRYVSASDVSYVLRGTGISILSTSIGILADREARKAHVGGELLCTIW